jgi:protein-S-isoprenylcysteine O-methyltransferase Ste14
VDQDLFVLTLANQSCIGALPFVFFRRDGSFNLRWWLTGSPFFVSAAGLVGAVAGLISPWQILGSPLPRAVAVLLTLASVGLIFLTIGTHRVALALWHQREDAPQSIVTDGPYRYVRHPFYTAFLLAQLAALLVAPHWLTVFGLLHAAIALSMTARREEQRLLGSAFGSGYRDYMQTTGRFFPGIGRLAR